MKWQFLPILTPLERCIETEKPDVVCVDILDKVPLSGSFAREDIRLTELYGQARSIAKRYGCVFMGFNQLSAHAEGKTNLDYGMLAGSKTGKAGEADLIILNHKKMVYPYQSEDINIVDVLIQRTKPKAVETVLVAGEVVYNEGKFIKVNRDGILSEIAEGLSYPLSKEEMKRQELARSVFPHVKKFYEDHYQYKENL